MIELGAVGDDAMINIGDWVRFYQNGKFVIGVVEYIFESNHYPHEKKIHTDQGTVYDGYILESRPKP